MRTEKPVAVTGLSVYFVRSGRCGPIKIGVATDVLSRAVGMQTGNPRRLTILATVPGGSEQMEAELHRRFRGQCVSGEWFLPTAELAAYVKQHAVPWVGPQPRLRPAKACRPDVSRVAKTLSLPAWMTADLRAVAKYQNRAASAIVEELLRPYLDRAKAGMPPVTPPAPTPTRRPRQRKGEK